MFDAYDVEAFHYLVKPVDREKLKGVLKRAVEKERRSSHDYIVVTREWKLSMQAWSHGQAFDE